MARLVIINKALDEPTGGIPFHIRCSGGTTIGGERESCTGVEMFTISDFVVPDDSYNQHYFVKIIPVELGVRADRFNFSGRVVDDVDGYPVYTNLTGGGQLIVPNNSTNFELKFHIDQRYDNLDYSKIKYRMEIYREALSQDENEGMPVEVYRSNIDFIFGV